MFAPPLLSDLLQSNPAINLNDPTNRPFTERKRKGNHLLTSARAITRKITPIVSDGSTPIQISCVFKYLRIINKTTTFKVVFNIESIISLPLGIYLLYPLRMVLFPELLLIFIHIFKAILFDQCFNVFYFCRYRTSV